MAGPLQHAVRRMTGRDPDEEERASTPLELLFDLTFVIAFGTAADQLTEALARGQVWAGVGGFALATFAVSWAWINFSWFASAYDTDDWVFRLLTMAQMVGVLVLALGLTSLFESLEHGHTLDIRVTVIGYAIMRAPMVLQWMRAGHEDPERADICRVMVRTLLAAEVLWILIAIFLHASILVTSLVVLAVILVEVAGPLVAESRHGGTPWHGGHIAERYGLMVIIALGEGLLGTAATLQALLEQGWSVHLVVFGVAGVGLTFGVWWTYFVVPHGPLLTARRERSFGWGYGHIVLFGAVVAIGAGVHLIAYDIVDFSELSHAAMIAAVALPVAIYLVTLFALTTYLGGTYDPIHVGVLAGTGVLLLAGVVAASLGLSLVWCLVIVALAPWASVVGYETLGHRRDAALLEGLDARE